VLVLVLVLELEPELEPVQELGPALVWHKHQ